MGLWKMERIVIREETRLRHAATLPVSHNSLPRNPIFFLGKKKKKVETKTNLLG